MKQWSIWSASLLLLCACEDRVSESPVPAGLVRYSCNPTLVNIYMEQGDPQVPLESSCGWVRLHDASRRVGNEAWGTGGLLLVHGFEQNHFYAYDLACPYCYAIGAKASTRIHQIEVNQADMKAYCPTCESQFGAIFWGSSAPTAGPANEHNYPLRQYRVSLLGEILTVTR